MIRYELGFLVPKSQIEGIINECYVYEFSKGNYFSVIKARMKIDNLCSRVNKEKSDALEARRQSFSASGYPYFVGSLSLPKEEYDGLTYDYRTVEAPIIKELRLKKTEDERNAAEARRREEIANEKIERQLRTGNEYYFQINVTNEQKQYAIQLVDYSIRNYPVTDIFAHDPDGKRRQREFRFTGTLGEVVFADAYGLPRPTRSFGAIDGQDHGQDFTLQLGSHTYSIDVKSMHRKGNAFLDNYVLNIPSYQLHKSFSKTDFYFCISFHEVNGATIATFIGLVKKDSVLSGKIGDLFKQGTKRIREDHTSFTFMRDTYEIMFKDISTPLLTDKIRRLPGFAILHLAPGSRKNNIY